MINRLRSLIQEKGFQWTYNYIYFNKLYSTNNSVLIKLQQLLQLYPSCIEIEITTKCPLKCTFCEHTYWNEPNINMALEDYKHILFQFPKLKWIGLTGIGEEFSNPSFNSMLTYTKDVHPSAFIEIYDSFALMKKEDIPTIMKVDRVFASIDAATKETYEKIRVNAKWDQTLNNLKEFIKLKNSVDSIFPELCFHFIITKDNIHEVIDYLYLIRSLDTDVCFIQFSQMLNWFNEVKDQYVKIPRTLIETVNNEAKKLDLTIVWGLNIQANKPPTKQCTAWTMPFIFVNGDVICCCATNERNKRDSQHHTRFGNIFKEDFHTIWNNQTYKEFRRSLRKNITPAQCMACPIFERGI